MVVVIMMMKMALTQKRMRSLAASFQRGHPWPVLVLVLVLVLCSPPHSGTRRPCSLHLSSRSSQTQQSSQAAHRPRPQRMSISHASSSSRRMAVSERDLSPGPRADRRWPPVEPAADMTSGTVVPLCARQPCCSAAGALSPWTTRSLRKVAE